MTQIDSQTPACVGTVLDSTQTSPADMAADMVADLNERVVSFAKARPVVTLIAALAAGFVLGKLAARI